MGAVGLHSREEYNVRGGMALVSGEKAWQVASGAVAQLTVVIQQAVAQATSSNGVNQALD